MRPWGWAGMVMALGGCTSAAPTSTTAEPSFAAQLAQVAAGQTDEIVVTAQPLTDDDLGRLKTATNLRVLKADHPESRVSAEGLKVLGRLPNLEHLRLRARGVDDAALAEIAHIRTLKILNLPRGEFTDRGLAKLADLPHLSLLRFGSPHVTDAGIKSIAALPALRQLHVIGLPLTDAALGEIANMPRLESFYADDMRFSDAAWEKLFRSRPGLHVHIDQAHHDRDPHAHPH